MSENSHNSTDELILPEVGSWWLHHKGGSYTVVGTAIIEATLEPCVVYRHAGAYQQWVRTLQNWHEEVVQADGSSIPRFRRDTTLMLREIPVAKQQRGFCRTHGSTDFSVGKNSVFCIRCVDNSPGIPKPINLRTTAREYDPRYAEDNAEDDAEEVEVDEK